MRVMMLKPQVDPVADGTVAKICSELGKLKFG
jgi:hypothetical protein